MNSITLHDNRAGNRYELLVQGTLVARAEYKALAGKLVFTHTELAPGNDGRGYGSEIARLALDDARSRGLSVVPACGFIAHYIVKHPQYADLVAAQDRAYLGN